MKDNLDRSEYYQQNKEKILQQEKEYREKNRERINAKCRERYAQNREKEIERSRKKHENNKEKERESNRLYREANRENLREWQRAYSQTEKKKEYNRRYYQEHKGEYVMTRERKDRANANDRKRRALSEEERIKHRKEATEWRKNNPTKSKAIKIRKYGITLEQFNALLEAQGGKCAICGMSDKSNPAKFPVVDHCHTNNHVRGLICSRCNSGLGFFKDSPTLPERLRRTLRKTVYSGAISK